MLLSQFVSILTLLYIQLQDVHCKVDITKMIENPLAHGFGDDIDWVKWDDAIETALDQNKPIFLLIHKSWCHACKGQFGCILLILNWFCL
ncbi:hypothetical protein AB6A40_001195 [Gnathostoma spinigerum]|uniref:Spermatogenesis-associated protein 20-like TRX domain-containing protein n=1 Tax=Gnathostoma spinigerum TaxID=75299 RepID=A0ABD6EAN8_9BILA